MRDATPHAPQDSLSDAVEAMSWSRDEPLFQCTAFKATRISDIVCKRTVTLFRDRITTTHQDLSGEKCWYLDRSCRIEPEYVEEIAAPEKRSVRPPGTWTVTAKLGTVTGSGQPVDLYCVTIHWPTSWLATRGYTSVALGFATAQEAALWHARVQQQISCLRLRGSKGDLSTGHSSKPSYDDRSVAWSGGGAIMRKPSQDKGFITAALESWLGNKEDRAAVSADTGGAQPQSMQYRMPTSPVQIPIPSGQNSFHEAGYGAEAQGAGLADAKISNASGLSVDVSDASFSSQFSDSCLPAASCNEQRWVPYRHTNGVAIYHHKESKCAVVTGCNTDAQEPGSEYMASSIVRGSPDECLAVLMNMNSNTTILGPASRFELLEDGDERQVLRFTVEATGMARHLCAPREVILERLFKREDCGVDVILFSSCAPPVSSTFSRSKSKLAASSASLQPGNSNTCSPSANSAWLMWSAVSAAAVALLQGLTGGMMPVQACIALFLLLVVMGCAYSASLVTVGPGGVSSSRSYSRSSTGIHSVHSTWRDWLSYVAAGGVLWYRPVLATAQGGYTISPREDRGGVTSPECLVTCILKVDLGGCLGERSWLRPFAAALGWVDAYIERMLMAVILVKDEVEQRRFLVQPFSMLTSKVGPSMVGDFDSSIGGVYDTSQAATASRRNSKRQQQKGFADEGMAQSRSMPIQSSYPVASGVQFGVVSPQQHALSAAAADHELQHIPSSAADLARHSSRMQRKHKGALGRMASRIYALRPRILGGSERTESSTSAPQVNAPLYKDSISFNSLITARRSPAASYPEPCADAAAPHTDGAVAMDLSDPKQLLASVGLPLDTVVVEPSYYVGGPQGPAAQDSTLNARFWSELHTPGTPAPFKLRGSTYLEDRNKVDGGTPQFVLGSVDLVETPRPTQHISRYLPAVRCNKAAYSFVVNLIIPGTPVLSLVAVLINEHHPDILDAPQINGDSRGTDRPGLNSSSGTSDNSSFAVDNFGESITGVSNTVRSVGSGYVPAQDGKYSNREGTGDDRPAASSTLDDSDADGAAAYERPAGTSDWQPFDYALHRFLHGGDETRTSMFKLIPHIAEGSWVIKQSVGTVPVILGNKLKTVYYQTDRYIEACVDVTSSSAAAYITGMVRGATKSLVIDLGFVLEGQHAEELPEALLGAFRLNYLDCTTAKKIDTSRELPLLPRPLQHHQLMTLQQQAQQSSLVEASNNSSKAACIPNSVPEPAASAISLQGLNPELSNITASSSGNKEQQQLPGDNAEQQPAANALYLQQLAQQLQQRCRNSWGAVDSSRTMTGHARSRSATSVEELISSSNSPRSLPVMGSRLQHKHIPTSNCSSEAPGEPGSAHRQWLGFPGAAPAATTESARSARPEPASSASNTMLTAGSGMLHDTGSASDGFLRPLANPTANAAVTDAAAGVPAAAFGTTGGTAPAVVTSSNSTPLTPAKQLLSSLLNFGAGEKGSASKSAAASSPDPVVYQGAAGDAYSICASAAAPQGRAQASCLSTAGSGVPASSSPAQASLAAGVAGSLVGAATSAGIDSPGGLANLTHWGHHHRSSSNSEGKGPAGLLASSPPAGDAATKLSAADYISRAHASALAASAQHRTQQQQLGSQQLPRAADAVDGHSANSCYFNAQEDAGSMSSSTATAYLSVSPGSGTLHGHTASGGSASQRKRTSSGGHSTTAAKAIRAGLPESTLSTGTLGVSCGNFGPGSPVDSKQGSSQRLSASEQLKDTHRVIRSSSLSGCHPDHHHSTNSSSSSMHASAGTAAGNKYSGGSGGSAAVAAGRGVVPQQQPQQQKRRSGHRRFASMGAVQ